MEGTAMECGIIFYLDNKGITVVKGYWLSLSNHQIIESPNHHKSVSHSKTTFMDNTKGNTGKTGKSNDQAGGITDKKDLNSGSSAFNEGSAQDPNYNDGVADGTANPDKVSKEDQNPKK